MRGIAVNTYSRGASAWRKRFQNFAVDNSAAGAHEAHLDKERAPPAAGAVPEPLQAAASPEVSRSQTPRGAGAGSGTLEESLPSEANGTDTVREFIIQPKASQPGAYFPNDTQAGTGSVYKYVLLENAGSPDGAQKGQGKEDDLALAYQSCRWGWLGLVLGLLIVAVTVGLVLPRMPAASGVEAMAAKVVPPSENRSSEAAAKLVAPPVPAVTSPPPPSMNGSDLSTCCNARLPIDDQPSTHDWQALNESWRAVCARAQKRRHPAVHMEEAERNWCWVGVKEVCHHHLKKHMSWQQHQELASHHGLAPRVGDAEPFHPLSQPDLCDAPENGASNNWTTEEKALAERWFLSQVQVYVLNLPRDTDRWEMISARLHSLKIQPLRVEGIDMREPDALSQAVEKGYVPKEYNFTQAQDAAYTPEQQMGSITGTLGCAAAHFKAHTHIIAGARPLALVFEDDTWPEDDFIERLWSLVKQELPCDWEVVSLMSRCPYGRCTSQHLTRVQPDANEPFDGCYHGVNWGMHGVLYRASHLKRVKELWQSTVFDETRPRCLDVDVALASISDQVGFYAVPSVQKPGFLQEKNYRSARWDINVQAGTTSRQPQGVKQMIGRPWALESEVDAV